MDGPGGQSGQPQSTIYPYPKPLGQIWTRFFLLLVGIFGSISVMVSRVAVEIQKQAPKTNNSQVCISTAVDENDPKRSCHDPR